MRVSFSKVLGNIKKRRMLCGFLVLVFVFTVLFSTNPFMGNTIPRCECDEVQQIRHLAGCYGIVAETASIESDMQSNIRTDFFSYPNSLHNIGSDKQYDKEQNMGEIVIGNVAGNVTQLKAEHDATTKLTLSKALEGKFEILSNNLGYEIVYSEELAADDVQKTLEVIASCADELSKYDNDVSLKYLNERGEIDKNKPNTVTCPADKKVVFADVPSFDCEYDYWDQLKNQNVHIYAKRFGWNPSTIKIEKAQNQVLIMNINDIGNSGVYMLDSYTAVVDQTTYQSTEVKAIDDISCNIIFNFGKYSGDIYINSSIAGMIIAPCANVIVRSTSTGQVICKNFRNPGGEWHAYSINDDPVPTPTPTATPTPTPEPTATPIPTPTPEPTATPTPDPTATPTPDPTATPTPTSTATPTPTATATPTPTATATPTPTATATPTPTATATPTPTATATPTPTATATPTPTATATPTPTATASPTPTATATPTPTATATPTPTATATPTPTTVVTSTPTPTPYVPVNRPTPTPYEPVRPRPSISPTPVPTATPTPIEIDLPTPPPQGVPDKIKDDMGTDDPIDIDPGKTPQGLPKTGTLPCALFYGVGAWLTGMGIAAISWSKRKE